MTNGPDLHELIGDVPAEERERLERVHELLVRAGPPAELSPMLAEPATPPAQVRTLQRRRWGVLALAASFALALFMGGYLVGHDRAGFDAEYSVEMRGVGEARQAFASLEVGEKDESGNYPMVLKVRGLKPVSGKGYYELLVARNGKPVAPCGSFLVHPGTTTVRLNAPYDLEEFNEWVVTVHPRGHIENPPIVMKTV